MKTAGGCMFHFLLQKQNFMWNIHLMKPTETMVTQMAWDAVKVWVCCCWEAVTFMLIYKFGYGQIWKYAHLQLFYHFIIP